MTRKDFQRVADAIRMLDLDRYATGHDVEHAQRKYIAAAMATALAPTNPRFDRDRFIRVATEGGR